MIVLQLLFSITLALSYLLSYLNWDKKINVKTDALLILMSLMLWGYGVHFVGLGLI